MLWVPANRLEVDRVATPLLLTAGLPSTVDPSSKLTVPFAGLPPVAVTVAVKMMAAPASAGLSEEASAVLVDSRPTPERDTVCFVPAVPDALSVMVKVAGPRLPLAPGLKVSLTVQAPPAARDPSQVFEEIAKSLASVPDSAPSLEIVRGVAKPSLLTVTLSAEPVVPTVCSGKGRLAGVTLARGAVAARPLTLRTRPSCTSLM